MLTKRDIGIIGFIAGFVSGGACVYKYLERAFTKKGEIFKYKELESNIKTEIKPEETAENKVDETATVVNEVAKNVRDSEVDIHPTEKYSSDAIDYRSIRTNANPNITEASYAEYASADEVGYSKKNVNYYYEYGILCEEDGTAINHINSTVTHRLLSTVDPEYSNILYVRNDILKIYYQVIFLKGDPCYKMTDDDEEV